VGRSLLFCIVQLPLAVLATAVLTAIASLAGLARPGAVQALSRVWSRLLLRLFRVDVLTQGQEHMPRGAAVYAANHSSSLDILVVLAHLPADVRIVYKNYVVHPDRATAAAWATCAANEQGKFAEFNKILWEKGFPQKLADTDMHAFAGELKLNVDKFKADMASDKCKQDVANDQKILSAVGVTGTPAFYINGRFLSGARPIEQFKAVIDEELKKANDTMGKDGLTASNYYQKAVVEKGKKAL